MKFKLSRYNNLAQHYQTMETAVFSVMQQKLDFTYGTDVICSKNIKLYSKHCSSLADGL